MVQAKITRPSNRLKNALLEAGIIPVFAVTTDVTSDYEALVEAFGFGTVVPLSSDSSDIIAAFEDGISGAADTLIENAIGTDFDDTILGNSADNFLKGKAGNDKIRGATGDDTIVGNKGKDNLEGGKGDDELRGGLDKDRLTGGDGADAFVFNVFASNQGQRCGARLRRRCRQYSRSERCIVVFCRYYSRPKGIECRSIP